MTEPERAELRRRISDARRLRLRADRAAAGLPPELACERCGVEMEPHYSGALKRFCSDGCRKYWWHHNTPLGRKALIEKSRRWRRRKGMPRRPGAEVAL